jgi:hypothetical protein
MPHRHRPTAFMMPILVSLAALGCSGALPEAVYPAADLRPPSLVQAGPSGATSVVLRFDEAVRPVEGSLAARPSASLAGKAEGAELLVSFDGAQTPGADYALSGEVDDLSGNRTRFLIRFAGWNDRAPPLRLSEAQTGKNSSKTKPHRDFVELEALVDGNIGGEELFWASSAKSSSYRFPAAELKKGDRIVLHLAPEGIEAERDELGADLSASGGIDASASGRDFWCADMALPDASGVIAVALRPGEDPSDGLFYAEEGKEGKLPEGDMASSLAQLAKAGAWVLSGSQPAWEDGFRWKGSSGKSICRAGAGKGPAAWYACASSCQSPGEPNGPSEAEGRGSRAAKKTAADAKQPKAPKSSKVSKKSP